MHGALHLGLWLIGIWSFQTPFLTLWAKLVNQEATISSHNLQPVPQKLMTYTVHTYRQERAHTHTVAHIM